MTKQIVRTFCLVLLAGASVFAQTPVVAQIPFSFHIGGSKLPAGSYTAEINASLSMLRLRSDDSKSHVMILTNRVSSNGKPTATKLVFSKYGDEYFLRQVWAGADTGTELRVTKLETEYAAALPRTIQTLRASR